MRPQPWRVPPELTERQAKFARSSDLISIATFSKSGATGGGQPILLTEHLTWKPSSSGFDQTRIKERANGCPQNAATAQF
jgi:hypothetical protein